MSIVQLFRRVLRREQPAPPVRRRRPKRDLSQDDWLLAEEASALLQAAQDDPRVNRKEAA